MEKVKNRLFRIILIMITIQFVAINVNAKVTRIEMNTYVNENFSKFELSDTTIVSAYGFYLSKIDTLVISGVTGLNPKAFSECTFDVIKYNPSKELTSSRDGTAQACRFYECRAKKLEIGDNVKIIKPCMFYIHGIYDLVIPSSVTDIGENSFNFLKDLKSVVVGANVESIDYHAFGNIDRIFWLGITPPKGYNEAFYYSSNLNPDYSEIQHYVRSNKYTNIKNVHYFQHLNSLFDVNGFKYVPVDLKNRKCYLLDVPKDKTDLIIEGQVIYRGTQFKVDKVYYNSCSFNYNIQSLTINCDSIGERVFTRNFLKHLTIGESVRHIDINAFPESFLQTINWNAKNAKVEKKWFNYDYRLKIEFGNTVDTIPNNFLDVEDNQLLKFELQLPNTVKYIGDGAFNNCSGLTNTNFVLPDSVKYIGDSAFYNCSGLSKDVLIIPDSVKSIGSNAFAFCPFLGVKVGKSVETIKDKAFYFTLRRNGENFIPLLKVEWNAINLKECGTPIFQFPIVASVIIGDSVKNVIGLDNLGIHTMVIGKSVSKISSKTSADIVIWLPDSAPTDCDVLMSKSVTNYVPNNTYPISNNVEVYPYLNSYVSKNDVIYVPTNISNNGTCNVIGFIPSHLGCEVEVDSVISYNDSKLKVIDVAPRTFMNSQFINLSVSISNYGKIGEEAFANIKLMRLNINENVKIIDKKAFINCSGYNPNFPWFGVDMPNSLISVNDSAFYGCSNLSGINFKEGLKIIGKDAFNGCSGLGGELKIPNSVTSIGESAFYGCGLNTLIIGDSLKTIETSTFENCINLTSLTLGSGLSKICDKAFSGCAKLSGITNFGESLTEIGEKVFYGCTKFGGDLVIPNSVRIIGESAFNGCKEIKSVRFGNSLSVIKDLLFYGCENLNNLIISHYIDSIGSKSFSNCSIRKLVIEDCEKDLYLKDNVTFSGSPLDSVYIGRNINYKGTSMFSNRTIKSLVIGNKVTDIKNREFANCRNLQRVSIGDGVQSVGDYAFSGCEKLSSITFGVSVSSIGEKAFNQCETVENITSYNNCPPLCASNSLEHISKLNSTLMLMEGAETAYMNAIEWQDFLFYQNIPYEGNVATPIINHVDNLVTIECATENAVIYYTTDGSEPTVKSTQYRGSFALEQNCTIKAMAVKSKCRESNIVSYDFIHTVMFGDVNGDKIINVTDVVTTASYILGYEVIDFSFSAADITCDMNINVSDIVGISSIILNGSMDSALSSSYLLDYSRNRCDDYIRVIDYNIDAAGIHWVELNLYNRNAYTAFQMDIQIPKGLEIIDCITTNRTDNHIIAYNMMSNGTVRLIGYSISNNEISSNEGAIVKLKIKANNSFEDGEICFDNIVLTQSDMTEYHLNGSNLSVKGTSEIEDASISDCKVYSHNGDLIIKSPKKQMAIIMELNGTSQVIELKEGENIIPMRYNNIYIVKIGEISKKVIVKCI